MRRGDPRLLSLLSRVVDDLRPGHTAITIAVCPPERAVVGAEAADHSSAANLVPGIGVNQRSEFRGVETAAAVRVSGLEVCLDDGSHLVFFRDSDVAASK